MTDPDTTVVDTKALIDGEDLENVAEYFANTVDTMEGYVTEAAPHVWSATTAHVQINAFAWLLTVGIVMVASFIFAMRSNKAFAKENAKPKQERNKDVIEATGTMLFLSGAVFVVSAITFFCQLPGNISELTVPEYHAMHEIADLILD